jgi:putative membrane protein
MHVLKPSPHFVKTILTIGVLMVISTGQALAHPIQPTESIDIWKWNFEPWIVVCMFLSISLYWLGLSRLWRKAGSGEGIPYRQALSFTLGWISLAMALVSPLDYLGNLLFSAHMLQHELLMIVAAPLMVLGRPFGAWAWSLPNRWRRLITIATHANFIRQPWRLITTPLSAWLLHALALWMWHLPVLFQAALHHEYLHVLQHLSFLFSALLFWWAVFGTHIRSQPGGWPLLLIFTTMLHTGALGALLSISPTIWYPDYIASTYALDISPLQDQQLGGLIMWIPASISYLLSGLYIGYLFIKSNVPHSSIAR